VFSGPLGFFLWPPRSPMNSPPPPLSSKCRPFTVACLCQHHPPPSLSHTHSREQGVPRLVGLTFINCLAQHGGALVIKVSACVYMCVCVCVCLCVFCVGDVYQVSRPARWCSCHQGVLQCVAVRCSALQCVAACCSVLQRVAVCCSVLQCVAVRCSMLQRVSGSTMVLSSSRCVVVRTCVFVCTCVCVTFINGQHGGDLVIKVCCSALQCVAVCCSVLQCVAVRCIVLPK